MNLRRVYHDGRSVLLARWYLRRATSVGTRVRLRGRPIIVNLGRMSIGSRVQLVSTAVSYTHLTLPTNREV